MNSEPFNHLKYKSPSRKKLSILIKIFLVILIGLGLLIIGFEVNDYVHCHTDTICDYVRPTPSPERKATFSAQQYDMAIQDINSGRYEVAKQRLEYIIVLEKPTEYPMAKEKLKELEIMIKITPTPTP
jgi:hypothetical protein